MHKIQIDKARAREERRRANLAAARERERASARAEALKTEDEARAGEARAALAGWSHVRIERHGGFWVAAGRAPDGGAPFATTDADPAAAAQRILAAAQERQGRTARLQLVSPKPKLGFGVGGARNDPSADEIPREDGGAEGGDEDLARPKARGPEGVLVERDEIARLRLALSMEVDRMAAARIAQRFPNDAADVERARDLNNLLMLGLITETQREELDGLNARVGWARQVEEVARAAKRRIAEAEAQALGSFDVAEIAWPE